MSIEEKKIKDRRGTRKPRSGIPATEAMRRYMTVEQKQYDMVGTAKHQQGYRLLLLPLHPYAEKSRGYYPEHKFVMESVLGRLLLQAEVVHHKDGNRTNNHPDNLELFENNAQHMSQHNGTNPVKRHHKEPNCVISCACGCGKKFLKYDKWGRPRKYISGHNNPWITTNDPELYSNNTDSSRWWGNKY